MKPYERTQLLERVEREAATVGAEIPAELVVQGEPVPLRRLVFEARSHDTVPTEERERVETTKRDLRRERRERKQRLEDADISREEGEEIVTAIVGIDRALNALGDLGPAEIEDEATRKRTADQKRWMNFLKQALGHEQGGGSTGHDRRANR